jgi:hypothetical protein
MPIQLVVYVPQQVYYLHLQGAITDAELVALDEQIVALLAQSTAPMLHLLIDQRAATQLPSIQAQSQVKMVQNPKLGWTVLIGNNKLMQFLGTVVAGVLKTRLRYFASFVEAMTFLQQVDTTLPDLNAHEYRQNIAAYQVKDAP